MVIFKRHGPVDLLIIVEMKLEVSADLAIIKKISILFLIIL